MQILACCPVSSGYTMHWLCEQDKHTYNMHTPSTTLPEEHADVEDGCSTCAVLPDDLEKQSLNPFTLLYRSVFQRLSGVVTPQLHVPSLFSPTWGLTESAINHSKSHFHNSIGKSNVRDITVKIINTLLQNIHY